MAYKRQGKIAEAHAALGKIGSPDADAVLQMAILSLQENQIARAESELARAWQMDPASYEACYNLVLTRLTLGQIASAAELVPAAIDLAGKRDPESCANDTENVSAALAACVDAVAAPAYVLDRFWNAYCWNAAAERLFVGWLDVTDERNLLRFTFRHPGARSLICDWQVRARRLAAEFRASSSARFDDLKLRALIAELHNESEEFAQYWDQQGVLGREGGERTFNHPTNGFLRYEQITFNLASQPDFKLTMLIRLPDVA